jgi:hypothetical protein
MFPTDKLHNDDSTQGENSLIMSSTITTVVDNDKEDSWSVNSMESSIEEEEQGDLKLPADELVCYYGALTTLESTFIHNLKQQAQHFQDLLQQELCKTEAKVTQ